MNDLETRLQSALRRQQPPPGFAAEVLRKASRVPPSTGPGRPWLLAAALLLVVGGLWGGHVHAEQRRAQVAQAQLLLALRITSRHLNEAFQRVNVIQENP